MHRFLFLVLVNFVKTGCVFFFFFFFDALDSLVPTAAHAKVFVANPKKPPEVTKILVNNKVKLIAYLENFHNERVRILLSKC